MYPRLVNLIRLVWLLAIAWYELGTFYHHTASCPWPDEHFETLDSTPTHVLVVADPQIPDRHSYPDRAPWLQRLSQLIIDLNIRKSWRASLRRHPHAVVFLGDMMDNGRYAMPDDEYEAYFRRFKDIFAGDKELPMYYLPGNHDIGLGTSSPRYQFSDHAVDRYTSHFGVLNQHVTLANHTVWLIDAPGLVDEDRERTVAGMSYAQWARPDRTIAFVQSLAQSADPEGITGNTRPILFTHVPLSRPEGTSCGPLRERGTIRQGRGLGYQNLLSPQASQFLLQTIRPAVVFSGDDHDYCEYVHTVPLTDTKRPSPPASVPEITVKSFSMAMGVRRPGYQLLSLVPPSLARDGQSLAYRPCLLPDQLSIYLSVYIPLFVLSLIMLLAVNVRRVVIRHAAPSARSPDSMHLTPTADGSVDYDLPPPSAWRNKEFPRYGLWSWTFTLGGSRRRLVLSRPGIVQPVVAFLWKGTPRENELQKRAGVAKGVVKDLWEAAWAPLVLFVGIAWWVW
ncbi:Metallo-dependent phosphatase [Lentinus tigrinus ALCF2SS1-7]|uniref:Metallo-dependent phosphatase n=1 Tax=Lentinus tigrinus ALCF2SS1-7 TaxID=1328758 RepID=UPI001165D0F9|nr:Metallo-dependent phosphatase [Lentinus tigrinus ALCF2SS1-7]